MFNLDDDAPARRLAYLSAIMLIFVPLLQLFAQLWPLQLGNIQWRFQAANVASGVLLYPFLGLAIMALVARASESRGVSRTIGIISAIIALVLSASLVLFVLDAIQLKAIVNSRAMQGFQVASVRVGLVTTLFLVLFIILALTALRPPAGIAPTPVRRAGRKQATDENSGLLIGQEFAKAE